MPKKYRKKTEVVEVLKTYHGQPMEELKDFLQGRLHLSSGPGVVLFKEVIAGDYTVTPGDYILKSECGKITTSSATDFNSEYEPVIDTTEIYWVVREYAFTIEQAHTMLSNSETRAVLLENLRSKNKDSRKITINQTVSDNTDIKKIAERLSGILSEEYIRKHVYSR